MVIGDLIGVPADERGFLVTWTQRIADLFGTPQANVDLARAAQQAMLDANTLLRELIAERKKHSTGDAPAGAAVGGGYYRPS